MDATDFYGYKAYFLAAEGIAQYKKCSKADEIVEQVAKWATADSNKNKDNNWWIFVTDINEAAKSALFKTYELKAIETLEKLITNTYNYDQFNQIVDCLYELDKKNCQFFRSIMIKVINNCQDKHTLEEAIYCLCLYGVKDDILLSLDVINFIIEFIRLEQDSDIIYEVLAQLTEYTDYLHKKNSVLKSYVINRLEELIKELIKSLDHNNIDTIDRRDILENHLETIITGRNPYTVINKIDISALSEYEQNLMEDREYVRIKSITIRSNKFTNYFRGVLEDKNDQDDLDVINALIKIIQTSDNDNSILEATTCLAEIGKKHPNAINLVIQVFSEIPNKIDKFGVINPLKKSESTLHQLIERLGEIAKGKRDAVSALTKLIQKSSDEYIVMLAAESLGKTEPGNIDALTTLINIIQNSDNNYRHRREAAERLGKIGKGNVTAINMLVEMSQNSIWDDFTLMLLAQTLDIIEPANIHAINALIKLISNAPDKSIQGDIWISTSIREEARSCLSKHKGNNDVINSMIEIINIHKNEDACHNAVFVLEKVMIESEMRKIVANLKNFVEKDCRLDRVKYKTLIPMDCVSIIWKCSEKMSYPEFYQAWHNQSITIHPETAEITGIGSTSTTKTLNLAQLPQLLNQAIAKESIRPKPQLVYIDGSQIIDRLNPAPEIYDQILDQGYRESSGKTPSTMQKLKLYYKSLWRDNDKKLILVLYENPTVGTPQGFSEELLNTFAQFTVPICAVNINPDEVNTRLQQFSANDNQLIINIIGWINNLFIEQHGE